MLRTFLRNPTISILIYASLIWSGCHQASSRSGQDFEAIRSLIQGKSAEQVLILFGEPDTKHIVLGTNERWVWQHFTQLDGEHYPHEIRGLVVNLEITFRNPSRLQDEQAPYSQWFVHELSGVSFKKP